MRPDRGYGLIMKKTFFKIIELELYLLLAVGSIWFFTNYDKPQVKEEPIAEEPIVGAVKTSFVPTLLPLTDSTYEVGTSTNAFLRGNFDELCLTGDSCETSWPAGGGSSAWEQLFGGGDIAITPTTTNAGIFVTASSTIQSSLRVDGTLNVIGNTTLGVATTTNLGVTSLAVASCDVKATTDGDLYCGTDASGASAGAAWQRGFDVNTITPTTTNVGIYVSAASSTITNLRVADSLTGQGVTNAWNALHNATTTYPGFATQFASFYNATTTQTNFLQNWNALYNATTTQAGFQTQFNTALNATTTTDSDNTWTIHNSFPAACTNQFIRQIGDTNTCASVGVNDMSMGNWKTFYSDDDGTMIELSLGNANTFLMSNGSGVAPTFSTINTVWNALYNATTTATNFLGQFQTAYNNTTTLNGFTNNQANWNTAYGWGDHSGAGYYAAASYTTDWNTLYNATTTLAGEVYLPLVGTNANLDMGAFGITSADGNFTDLTVDNTLLLTSLITADCDLKATEGTGEVYCGTDATSVGGGGGAAWEALGDPTNNIITPTSTGAGIVVNAASSTITNLVVSNGLSGAGHTAAWNALYNATTTQAGFQTQFNTALNASSTNVTEGDFAGLFATSYNATTTATNFNPQWNSAFNATSTWAGFNSAFTGQLNATSTVITEGDISTVAKLNVLTGSTLLISGGTLTSSNVCQYDGTGIDCDLPVDASGACAAGAVCTGGHTHVGVNETYGSGWNADTDTPEKDDVYDYLHLIDTNDDGDVDNMDATAFTTLWNTNANATTTFDLTTLQVITSATIGQLTVGTTAATGAALGAGDLWVQNDMMAGGVASSTSIRVNGLFQVSSAGVATTSSLNVGSDGAAGSKTACFMAMSASDAWTYFYFNGVTQVISASSCADTGGNSTTTIQVGQ